MPQMQDKSICKGRKAAAVSVLQKLYEIKTVNDAANDTAAQLESRFVKRNTGGIVCGY